MHCQPRWIITIVASAFLDGDSICVGQQARCVTAFLLLLAAEWAASNRYKCISWEEMIFFQCPAFCDEPLLLIQCATAGLFGLFILFTVYFTKLFLDEERLNHGMFLQVTAFLRMAVLVVFLLLVVLNVWDMLRGCSAPEPFVIKPFFQTCISFLDHFSLLFFEC